jgi:hypothetical protein
MLHLPCLIRAETIIGMTTNFECESRILSPATKSSQKQYDEFNNFEFLDCQRKNPSTRPMLPCFIDSLKVILQFSNSAHTEKFTGVSGCMPMRVNVYCHLQDCPSLWQSDKMNILRFQLKQRQLAPGSAWPHSVSCPIQRATAMMLFRATPPTSFSSRSWYLYTVISLFSAFS